jgi:hypothetical protein
VSCITKKSCPHLASLDLSRNPISQAEVNRIRQELVGCEVTAGALLSALDLSTNPAEGVRV